MPSCCTSRPIPCHRAAPFQDDGTRLLHELTAFIDLSSGSPLWDGATPAPYGALNSSAMPALVRGSPESPWPTAVPVGGTWMGVDVWDAEASVASQPALGCVSGEHVLYARFDLSQTQLDCAPTLSLQLSRSNTALVSASLNGAAIAWVPQLGERLTIALNVPETAEALSHAWDAHDEWRVVPTLKEGTNLLRISFTPVIPLRPCGVSLLGGVGRFHHIHKMAAVTNPAAAWQAIEFSPLPAGTVVLPLLLVTNAAGLTSSVALDGGVVMLDDSPPLRAELRGCTPGGRTDADGTYYQPTTEGLWLCWDPTVGGFADPQSGLVALEWQLARWVASSGRWDAIGSGQWDTLGEAQVLAGANLTAVLSEGVLRLSSSELTALTGGRETPSHPERYRLGLRGRNAAGLRSCGDASCSAAGQRNWAAFEGVHISVDTAPPLCASARAWVCDPLTPDRTPETANEAHEPCRDIALSSRVPLLGAADGGFQVRMCQWRACIGEAGAWQWRYRQIGW